MNKLPEQYHSTVAEIVKIMREIMLAGDELFAMAFFGKADAYLLPIPMGMSDDDKKTQSSLLVNVLASKLNPEFVVFFSEGYMLPIEIPPEEQFALYKKYGSIENCPERQEVVFLTIETPNGNYFAQQQILLLEGKSRSFEDFKFQLVNNAQGRFTNFLASPSRTVH